jgi:hypothetical protein
MGWSYTWVRYIDRKQLDRSPATRPHRLAYHCLVRASYPQWRRPFKAAQDVNCHATDLLSEAGMKVVEHNFGHVSRLPSMALDMLAKFDAREFEVDSRACIVRVVCVCVESDIS